MYFVSFRRVGLFYFDLHVGRETSTAQHVPPFFLGSSAVCIFGEGREAYK